MVSERPLRVGLIGAGRMVRAHLQALAEAREVETTAVVDPVDEVRDELRVRGLRTFAHVDELLDAGDADAAIVAAPTDLHLELVTAPAGAGLPVLCEKPCGVRSEEAAEAVRLAADAGAHVIRRSTIDELRSALEEAKKVDRTVVVAIETDRYAAVPGYATWWDVPVAEVAGVEAVREARLEYDRAVRRRTL